MFKGISVWQDHCLHTIVYSNQKEALDDVLIKRGREFRTAELITAAASIASFNSFLLYLPCFFRLIEN